MREATNPLAGMRLARWRGLFLDGLAMHPDAVMTYEDALIAVHDFPARLDWHPSPRLRRTARTSPSDAQAINHDEASFACVLNPNVCNSTLFHDPRMHRGDGLGQALLAATKTNKSPVAAGGVTGQVPLHESVATCVADQAYADPEALQANSGGLALVIGALIGQRVRN